MDKIIYSNKLAKYKHLIHGSSTKFYGSLIFSLGGKEDVIKNRERFLRDLDVALKDIVLMGQIHSARIRVVDRRRRGAGAFDQLTCIMDTDGLVTRDSGVYLGVLTADCAPIICYDPVTKTIAVAHAGWQGTVKLIASRLVKKMKAEFNVKPENIIVWIGPSIDPCCYNVTKNQGKQIDIFDKVFKKDPEIIIRKNNKISLDLKAANKKVLISAGVELGNIEISKLCTSCNNNMLPSHRKEGEQRKTAIITIIGKYD